MTVSSCLTPAHDTQLGRLLIYSRPTGLEASDDVGDPVVTAGRGNVRMDLMGVVIRNGWMILRGRHSQLSLYLRLDLQSRFAAQCVTNVAVSKPLI